MTVLTLFLLWSLGCVTVGVVVGVVLTVSVYGAERWKTKTQKTQGLNFQ
jgi:type III secretory pathway component EscS